MLILILCCCPLFSQDSITLEHTVNEKKNLSFQEHFFDAITQKAIKNYQKAIVSLEECNSLIPQDKSVLFEFSKNYLKLNKTPEAIQYIDEAIAIDPENIWLLEHKVAIHKKDRDYGAAIAIQNKIAENHPKKREQVVYLHLKNKDNKSALKVINEMAKDKMLNETLRRVRDNLTQPKTIKATASVKNTTTKNTSTVGLKEQFAQEKSFQNLVALLEQLASEKNSELLDFSIQGIGLFPAQPLVYLMNGKAYNQNQEYKKAIQALQNGIDFVIDDETLEKQFYKEMIIAYKGMGDAKNAFKYENKL